MLTADKPVVNFADFQWIGTLLRDIRICYAWAATGIKTFADMMKRKEFLIGTTAKGSNAYVNGAILRNVFKAPVRQIAGYPGSNEQRLALERGELEGNCGSWTAMPQDWLVNNKINALLRFSATRPADMRRDVPYVLDLAQDARSRRASSTSSIRRANWGGRSSSPSRCRASGWRSCARHCRRR